jgi:hypothetical protein
MRRAAKIMSQQKAFLPACGQKLRRVEVLPGHNHRGQHTESNTTKGPSQPILPRGLPKIGSFDNTDEVLWSIKAGSMRQAKALKPEMRAGHEPGKSGVRVGAKAL